MKENRFPPGWDEQRVREVLHHYEAQTDEEALAEDEASFEDAPAGSSVDQLDGSLARAVDVRARERTLFPRLKAALQNLPPFIADTELLFRARTYYLPLVETDGTRANAWTLGGKLRYRSGWWRERLQIGAGLYTSYKLVADDPLALTQLLRENEQGFTVFGEAFLRTVPKDTLETMRQRFHERYKDRVHALVRLTEAQNPFFEGLEDRLDEYRAVQTPVLLCTGSQDRVLPLWQQTKMLDIFPDTRYHVVEGAGHVVYLEKKEIFFPMLKAFMRAKATDFEMPAG